MGSRSCHCGVLSWVVPALLLFLLISTASAQGLQTSPYSAPSMLRGLSSGGLNLAPSNPLGLPGSSAPAAGGSSSLYLSEGMLRGILPLIPNLQFGYLYDFGNNRVSSGRFTADYLLPFSLSPDSMIFGEAHTEFQDFWKTRSFNSRVDMSFGGGYRTLLKGNTLLGVNGFYDTSRLGSTWYSSGGVGFQMAALVGGSDAIDLNFNWYGQLFNSNVILNAFRYGPSNYDFEAGYSHELWNGGPDLRLKITGYEFSIGNNVYGWNAGAELKSRDGMFVVKYDVGHDRVNKTYQTLGGFVNVGFQLENIFRGESPFTVPEPIFKSPRSLWYMLTEKVKRDWHQSTAIVITRPGQQGQSQSQSSAPRKPFFQFILVDKTPVSALPFDQAAGVPLTALTSPFGLGFAASATSYAVIIVDPDKTLPATISVTLTPTVGTLSELSVDPATVGGPYTIAAGLTDGTPNVVTTTALGTPRTNNFSKRPRPVSGFFTITDTTTGTVTPLVVTVTGT